MPVTKENLKDVFTYHPPTEIQREQYNTIRTAAHDFAFIILDNTPTCADQQAALRLLREAVMTANAAVALNGKV
jgi:hypothetical protein